MSGADHYTERRFGLSFCSVTRTARGRIVSTCDFDVPLETFEDGYVTGLNAAGELLAALARGDRVLRFEALGMILAAAEAAREPVARFKGGRDVPSRRGAADAFLHIMIDMVAFAAGRADHAALVQHKVSDVLAVKAHRDARLQVERATFADRMKAARQAKRAAGAIA